MEQQRFEGTSLNFDLSPDGSLYNGDTEYVSEDCLNLAPSEDAVEESGADVAWLTDEI